MPSIHTVCTILLLLSATHGPRQLAGESLSRTQVPEAYGELWLEEIAPFISDAERTAFEQLMDARSKEAFKRAFWRARDGSPDLPVNPIKEQYLNHLISARSYGLPLSDRRSQVLLLHGPPMVRSDQGRCGQESDNPLLNSNCVVTRAFSLLDYGPDSPIGWAPVLFVQHEDECTLYKRDLDPPFLIHRYTPQTCTRPGYRFADRLHHAMKAHLSWTEIVERGLQATTDPAWLRSFDSNSPPTTSSVPPTFSIDRQEEASARDGTPVFRFDATFSVAIPESFRTLALPWRNLYIRADIFASGERLANLEHLANFDYFELYFDSRDDILELPMSLQTPAGRYTIVLHVEDQSLDLFDTAAFVLDAPLTDLEGGPTSGNPADSDLTSATDLAKAPMVRLAPLVGMVVGQRVVRLDRWQGPIARIDLLLDGERIESVDRPPYAVTLDFGPIPRERVLEIRATDRDGSRIASDRVTINTGIHDFDVSVHRSSRSGDAYSVHGRVDVPHGATLARVELHDVTDEQSSRLLLTTDEPEFTHTLRQAPGIVTVLEARAFLEDGRSSDDTLIVTGEEIDQIDVDLVEVFASVTNRAGRPLANLRADQFRIFEDGSLQTVRSFQPLNELPINVVLLLDTSSTMAAEIAKVRESALAFLENVIREDDRAAIVAFNHRTYVMAPLTNDTALLREASDSLRAWGGTSLFDSAVLALYYLHGLPGKKALVLVSDGVEENSDLVFEQLVEYADRVDASVYTLALGLPGSDPHLLDQARDRMRRIARQTGGASFRVKGRKQIDRAYVEIESDLRSQYLLTYESNAPARSGASDYRELEIRVDEPGARVRARPGYYP